MRKQLCLSSKSLKVDVLKWIAVLSKEGLNIDPLNSNLPNADILIKACFTNLANSEANLFQTEFLAIFLSRS